MSETRERLKRNTRKQRLPRLVTRLQNKLESFSQLLSYEGFDLSPEGSTYAHDFFQRLPLGVQRRIVRDLNFYVQLLEDFQRSGRSLWDSTRLTWAFLKSSGLQPCSTTFSQIEEKDVIEVYNSEYIQIFRNMRFFEHYCGSLFDLAVLDWMSLFRRDSQIEEQLFIQMDSCFRQVPKIKTFEGIPEHSVSLRFSQIEQDMKVSLKFRSGLMNRQRKTKRVEAVLLTSSILSVREYPRQKIVSFI